MGQVPELSGGGDAVHAGHAGHAGHADVDEGYVHLVCCGQFDGLESVGGLDDGLKASGSIPASTAVCGGPLRPGATAGAP